MGLEGFGKRSCDLSNLHGLLCEVDDRPDTVEQSYKSPHARRIDRAAAVILAGISHGVRLCRYMRLSAGKVSLRPEKMDRRRVGGWNTKR